MGGSRIFLWVGPTGKKWKNPEKKTGQNLGKIGQNLVRWRGAQAPQLRPLN